MLSGPRSYVNEVGRAIVSVDITGAEKNIKVYPEIVLYDKENNVISPEDMKMHKLHMNVSSVKVVATVYKTKDIPITCGSGVPIAYGYELISEPTMEPSSITVAGAEGILEDFDSIEIPASDVTYDYLTATMNKTLNIVSYLPEGVFLTDDSDASVTVYVRVREIQQDDGGDSEESTSGEAETSGSDEENSG